MQQQWNTLRQVHCIATDAAWHLYVLHSPHVLECDPYLSVFRVDSGTCIAHFGVTKWFTSSDKRMDCDDSFMCVAFDGSIYMQRAASRYTSGVDCCAPLLEVVQDVLLSLHDMPLFLPLRKIVAEYLASPEPVYQSDALRLNQLATDSPCKDCGKRLNDISIMQMTINENADRLRFLSLENHAYEVDIAHKPHRTAHYCIRRLGGCMLFMDHVTLGNQTHDLCLTAETAVEHQCQAHLFSSSEQEWRSSAVRTPSNGYNYGMTMSADKGEMWCFRHENALVMRHSGSEWTVAQDFPLVTDCDVHNVARDSVGRVWAQSTKIGVVPLPCLDKCQRGCAPVPGGLFRCSRCKVANYCSAKCQKEDWVVHKLFCHRNR